jgi:hypothetical protein
MIIKEELKKMSPESREKAERFFKLADKIKRSGVTEKYFKN